MKTKTLTLSGLALLALAAGAAAFRPAPQDGAAPAQALPEARTIVDRYLKETDPQGKLPGVQSIHTTGKLEIAAMGIGGTVDSYHKRPDRILSIADIAGIGSTKQGYDGKVAWMIQPMVGPMILDGFAAQQTAAQARFDYQFYPADAIETLETLEAKTFAGKECWKVRQVLKPFASTDPAISDAKKSLPYRESFHYFDKATGLLAGTEQLTASPNGDIKVTTTQSEYKEFAGAKFATKVVQALQGMEITITADTVTFDDVADDVFALPAEIAALAAKKAAPAKTPEEGDGGGR